MNRQFTLLTALGVVLVIVLAYLFVAKPKQNEIAQINTEIESTQDQQATVEAQIARLEDIRARIPEVEAAIAAAETIVPRDDPKLAAAVRQLQVAANESGIELSTVTMSRPTVVTSDAADVPADLASIGLSVSIEGGYYQIVDFLRRIEDPVISPRAILWNTSSVSLTEYPTLTANLAGDMYAYLVDPGAAVVEEEPTEETTDDDVDVDVDVEVVETEDAS